MKTLTRKKAAAALCVAFLWSATAMPACAAELPQAQTGAPDAQAVAAAPSAAEDDRQVRKPDAKAVPEKEIQMEGAGPTPDAAQAGDAALDPVTVPERAPAKDEACGGTAGPAAGDAATAEPPPEKGAETSPQPGNIVEPVLSAEKTDLGTGEAVAPVLMVDPLYDAPVTEVGAVLSVHATVDAGLTLCYQWQELDVARLAKQGARQPFGAPASGEEREAAWRNIEGAREKTLRIVKVNPDALSTKRYRCVVGAGEISFATNEARLILSDFPGLAAPDGGPGGPAK